MRNCNHCSEYDRKKKMCKVVFIINSEDYCLDIKNPDDHCILEREGLLQEIQSIRKWSDGKDGYIEYANARQEKT